MDYNFATCFICKEQGHIAKQCPDNQRGLYPKGGKQFLFFYNRHKKCFKSLVEIFVLVTK